MYLFALLALAAVTLIDLVHVIRGGEVKDGLFGLAVRGVVNITVLILLMVAVAGIVVLAAVGAVVFGVLMAGAWVLDQVTTLYRRVKFSNWLMRLRARGKSAEDRLELANAAAEGRRPVYGRQARLDAASRRKSVVNKDGRIESTR